MSRWPSTKAKLVYRALLRIGWVSLPGKGTSHVRLQRAGFLHDCVEIGPVMLSKIAKHTGLKPEDL